MTIPEGPVTDSIAKAVELLRLYYADGLVRLDFNAWLLAALTTAFALLLGFVAYQRRTWAEEFEIDEAELGVGNQKLKLRPNYQTAQIAYKLWVEVSTRKVGLPIDFDHDVISEVYDSWYEFFRVTRELLKDVPASQLRRNAASETLVHLAIDVLNEGLRPHLTAWQARFRRWYDRELDSADAGTSEPQELQRRYPRYEELRADMQQVNGTLIAYRAAIRRIVFDK